MVSTLMLPLSSISMPLYLKQGTQRAKESAAGALVNLTAKTDVNKFSVAAAGGIPPLVALLSKSYPSEVTAMSHECAAAVLCNLAFNNENRTDIASQGGIPLLVEVSWPPGLPLACACEHVHSCFLWPSLF